MEGKMSTRHAIVVPGLIILLGLGWLLTTLGVVPHVNWIWVLALAGTGVMLLVVAGVDRVSVIVGPFLIITGFMSVLRQTGRIEFNVEVPVLVIVIGVLMLVSRMANLPDPPPRAPRGTETKAP